MINFPQKLRTVSRKALVFETGFLGKLLRFFGKLTVASFVFMVSSTITPSLLHLHFMKYGMKTAISKINNSFNKI